MVFGGAGGGRGVPVYGDKKRMGLTPKSILNNYPHYLPLAQGEKPLGNQLSPPLCKGELEGVVLC